MNNKFHMKALFGVITGLFIVISMALVIPARVSAGMNHNSTVNLLYGCMPDDVASRLIGSGKFTISGGPIFYIICPEGYTAVYKLLP